MGLFPFYPQGVVDGELLAQALFLGVEEGALQVGLEGQKLRQKKPFPEGKLGQGQGLFQKGFPGHLLPQVDPEGEGGHSELVEPGGEEAGDSLHAPHPKLQLRRGVFEAHRPQPGPGEAKPGGGQAGEVDLVRQLVKAIEGDVG